MRWRCLVRDRDGRALRRSPTPTTSSTLLKAADKYRMSGDNMQIDTQISVFNTDGSPDKERRYVVFAQAKHQSLVLMQSPAEKGQKVLMLGDDYWLLMPGSQRPLRITPMQKLLGDASTGDIATLSWADDYTGSVAGEEPCGEPAQPCLHLALQANRKGVTYQRIELWIGKARHEPVRADLYVQSDKLAKRARFVMDKPGGADGRDRDAPERPAHEQEGDRRCATSAARSTPCPRRG